MTAHKNILTTLILLIPVGLGTKYYSGLCHEWVNNSFSDILYIIFWSLLLFLFLPKMKIHVNVLIIVLTTSLLEIMQLVKTDILLQIRQTFLGKLLLGTTFVWSDFLYYLIGGLISYAILNIYSHKKQITKNSFSTS